MELWSEGAQQCVESISPEFNRLVVFNTNKNSYYGHPQPLKTPSEITRKSLALYYYTARPVSGDAYDGVTDRRET